MESAELALFPAPFAGHQPPMVEFAKILASRDHRISITVFILNLPFHLNIDSYTRALLSNQPPPGVRFVDLPLDDCTLEYLRSKPLGEMMLELAQIHKQRVKDLLLSSESTHRLAGFIVDMVCTSFMDVAAEFGVPSYVFFTCNAGVLSFLFHLQSLQDDENRDITEFKDSDAELRVPGFVNPVPVKVLPYRALDKDGGGANLFVEIARKLRKAKGILVNTCTELEQQIVKSLLDEHTIAHAYGVGPILNLKAKTDNDGNDLDQHEATMMWLDNQPPASVVFLCFGSLGAFAAEQVAEIACALERRGHRFLWSLRRPPMEKTELPTEYEDLNDVLPEGFLDRTREIGKVVGWAPQIAVLSHPAVGGFVSHCGWNSILESLWHGVPVATWPIYAEQQMNAFEMVKELGLAVEIKLDYQKMEENQVIVTEEEIGKGIKQLMEGSESTQIRKKVKAMMEEIRMAVVEGGSSYGALGRFIQKVIDGSR